MTNPGIEEAIKRELKEDLEEEFELYKEDCLKELTSRLELKKYQIIDTILDQIKVEVYREDFSRSTRINVMIEPKIEIRRDS